MSWGKGIILSFVIFTAFVVVLVVICFRQEVSLVSKDYYQKELQFQQQIDRMNNTSSLTSKPDIEISDGRLTVDFQNSAGVDRGEIQLFRPSDSKLDRKFQVAPSKDKAHLFNLDGMPHGMYKVRMNWSQDGKDFYIEKTVQL